RPGDGWRWPRGVCSGRDSAVHIGDRRREASSKPSSFVETAAAARQRRSRAERGVSDLRGSGADRPGKPVGARRRTCRERLFAALVWEGSSYVVKESSGCDRGRGRRQERHNGHGGGGGVAGSKCVAH